MKASTYCLDIKRLIVFAIIALVAPLIAATVEENNGRDFMTTRGKYSFFVLLAEVGIVVSLYVRARWSTSSQVSPVTLDTVKGTAVDKVTELLEAP